MKKILTLDGMEVSIISRSEDFSFKFLEYKLEVNYQLGATVTIDNKSKTGIYQLTIEDSFDSAVYSAVQGISMDQFIDLILAELQKPPEDRYGCGGCPEGGRGWCALFDYLDGNIDQIVDI
jgi:hypothetical protein